MVFKRTVAWFDCKNAAVVHWRFDADGAEARIDGAVFWEYTSSEHFVWLIYHLLTVNKGNDNNSKEVRCIIENADLFPTWLAQLLPRFEWNFPDTLSFTLERNITTPAFQSFGKRIAAIFVRKLLPAWQKEEEEGKGEETEKTEFARLIEETNELAHMAVLHMVPLSTLAQEIFALLPKEVEEHEDVQKLLRDFETRGHQRMFIHVSTFFHLLIEASMSFPLPPCSTT